MPTPILWCNFSAQDGADNSGNGNTLTNNGATFTADFPTGGGGFSAVFNGSASMDAATAILTSDTGGISFWYKSTVNNQGKRTAANSHTDSDNAGFQIFADGSGAGIVADIADGVGGAINIDYESLGGGCPDDGAWHHMVVTWETTGSTAYVDNVAAPLGPSSGPSAAIGATSHFAIGYNPAYAGDYITAQLFDVRLFDVALTSTNVATLFANPFNPGGGTFDMSSRGAFVLP